MKKKRSARKVVTVSMSPDAYRRLDQAAALAVADIPGARFTVSRYLLASGLERVDREEKARQGKERRP